MIPLPLSVIEVENSFPNSRPLHERALDEAGLNRLNGRALEMSAVLQTTLETSELIPLFAKQAGRIVPFEGLSFRNRPANLDVLIGREPPHTAAYQIRCDQQLLGDIRFFRSHRFSERELVILEDSLIALIYPLRNCLQYHAAVQASLMDALTSVKNRAAFDQSLRREVDLAHRRKNPLSLILLDVDFFKRINDTHGHAAGDLALRTIARSTGESVRSSDILFRYGGEEFVVLLSGTDTAGAALLAERIREDIERTVIGFLGKDPVTVSLGVASLLPREDGQALFRRSDEALYRAKQNGRNRVEMAT